MKGTVGTIFAGIGGSTLGAKQAGFDPIWAVERSRRRSIIYRFNIDDRCLVQPVEDVKIKTLEPPTLLLATPPCQAASSMRKIRCKDEKHPDADAGFAVCSYISILLPQWFLLENIGMYRKEDSFEAIKFQLSRSGYQHRYGVLDCADYGIPMHRRRLFLVANRINAPIYFPMKHLLHHSWWLAVHDLWQNLPSRKLPTWMAEILEAGDKPTLMLDSKRNFNKKTAKAYLTKRFWNRPAFTITRSHEERPAYAIDDDWVSKRVTARMWARIMGYPDSFQLPQSERHAVGGLGDSVPPPMIQQICELMEVKNEAI